MPRQMSPPTLRTGMLASWCGMRGIVTLATALLESTILQQWFPRNRVLARYYVADRPDDMVQPVDWLMGACFMLRRQIVVMLAVFTATLLLCDAWFDIVLDWGTSEVWVSLASAAFVEVPLSLL